MPSYYLSPLFQDAQFDDDGDPLTGGKLEWYLAGTTTPANTYQTRTGTAHTWPIALNTRGEPPAPIWLEGGAAYKCVLKTAGGAQIRVVDYVSGVGDTQATNTTFGAITVDSTGNAARIDQSASGNLTLSSNQGSGAVNTVDITSAATKGSRPFTMPKLRVGDATTPAQAIEVSGGGFVSDKLRVGSTVAPVATLDVTGSVAISGTLDVDGDTTLDALATSERAMLHDVRISGETWRSLLFSAACIAPSGAGTDATRHTTTGTLVFSGTADNWAPLAVTMPPDWKVGTNVIFRLHLNFPNANTNATVWQLGVNIASPDGTFETDAGTYTLGTQITVPNPNSARKLVVAAFEPTVMTGKTLGAHILAQIWRRAASAGADTDASGQLLVAVEVLYRTDGLGQDTATTKT